MLQPNLAQAGRNRLSLPSWARTREPLPTQRRLDPPADGRWASLTALAMLATEVKR